VRQLKNCDKTADRSDQQASLTLAAVGFLAFLWRNGTKVLKRQRSCREEEGGTQKA